MTTTPARTVSLGCRLNAYEAERMGVLAAEAGMADAVIVNTCAVTNEAVRQSRQAVRRAAREGARVVVSGCAAQIDPDAFAGLPGVAGLLGNAEKTDTGAWGRLGAALRNVAEATVLPRAPAPVSVPVRAPLEVQNGCDHACTFCIIPQGRGRARSKTPEDALAEAEALVALGARELVLTGVDLTSWGPDLGEARLGMLVRRLLNGLPSHVTLRLSSIDGAEMDDELFALVTQEPRVAPYAHLSLQAGDDMILKRMKRRHGRADAVALCERLHAARPEIALGADLIAGFPTETVEMAARTRALVEDCALAFVHVFPFSARAGTPAARMPQVPRETVKARAAALREAAGAALDRHLDGLAGQVRDVLIEEVRESEARGKTACFADVALPATGLAPGDRVPATLARGDGRRLRGVPLPHRKENAHG